MIHRCKKYVCVLLSLVLMLQLVQPALAVWQEESQTAAASPEDVVLTDKDGNQTRPDKSWEEVYPYGAFAFDVNAAGVKEGEDAVVTVYRLGGTKGRATAYLNYNPTVVKNEDGSPYYGYGLSARDITLEVEEPLPAAQYQPLGRDPDPDRGSANIIRKTDSEGYVLSLSREADSYQWQILYEDRWCDVGQANRAELNMDAKFIDSGDLDFRCVYTADGKTLCTDSLNGVRYEKPEAEVLEPMPADLDLTAEPTYTALELADGDDLFAAWVFSLTFAEGEWKKELHIRANTDGLTEAMLTIYSRAGGTLRRGDVSSVSRRGDSLPNDVPCPSLTILGSATPEQFYETLTPDMIGEGLIGRFIAIEAARLESYNIPDKEETPPASVLAHAKKLLARGKNVHADDFDPDRDFVRVEMDGDGARQAQQALFEDNFERRRKLSQKGDADSRTENALCAREVEKIEKLALLYALSENAEEPRITVAGYSWASAFVRAHNRLLFERVRDNTGGTDESRLAQHILAFLRERGGTATKADITYRFRHNKLGRRKLIGEALGALVESGEITENVVPTQGRAKQIYALAEDGEE